MCHSASSNRMSARQPAPHAHHSITHSSQEQPRSNLGDVTGRVDQESVVIYITKKKDILPFVPNEWTLRAFRKVRQVRRRKKNGIAYMWNIKNKKSGKKSKFCQV